MTVCPQIIENPISIIPLNLMWQSFFIVLSQQYFCYFLVLRNVDKIRKKGRNQNNKIIAYSKKTNCGKFDNSDTIKLIGNTWLVNANYQSRMSYELHFASMSKKKMDGGEANKRVSVYIRMVILRITTPSHIRQWHYRIMSMETIHAGELKRMLVRKKKKRKSTRLTLMSGNLACKTNIELAIFFVAQNGSAQPMWN